MIQSTERRSRPVCRVLAIVAVVLVASLIAYVSLSDGVDYVHGFGNACLVIHDGWHLHIHCGSVSAPKS